MALVENDLFLGEVDKVKVAIERLKTFEPAEGYYLAFSGGKDSVVIKRLAEMAGVKFETHYHLTTVDPPELVHFIKEFHPDAIWHRPEKNIAERMYDKGVAPTRMIRWCCDEYKERGGAGRFVITGVRWYESARRARTRRMNETCFRDKTKHYLNAIVDWEDSDVWDFIHSQQVPYCSLYDEGFKRLGCVLCPMTTPANKMKEAARWPKIESNWKRWIYRLWEKQKEKRGDDYNFRTPEEYWNWWITGKGGQGQNPDQMKMYD